MNDDNHGAPTRRDVLAHGAALLAGGALLGAAAPTRAQAPAVHAAGTASRPNIVFVFTDQERYFRHWPAGFSLPGH